MSTWKRYFSSLLILSLILGLIPANPVKAATESNFVNPGFEENLVEGKIPGWSQIEGTEGILELRTEQYRSGSQSLYFVDSSDTKKLSVMSDPITVTGGAITVTGGAITVGKEYKAKAYAYVISQVNSLTFEVNYFNSEGIKINGTFLNFKSAKATDPLVKGQWSLMEVPFTVPEGTAAVKIYFTCGGSTGQNKIETYIDDITIEEVIPEPVEEVPQEIQNPGFELDLVEGNIPYWSVAAGTAGTMEISTTSSSGTKGLYFYDNSGSIGLRVISDKFTVSAGDTYTGKANVNVISQSHNIVYEIYYYNHNDVQVGMKQELFGELALGKNKWTQMRVSTTVPGDAVYARIAFYSGGVSITEAYFDDVTFEIVPKEIPLNRTYQEPVNLGDMVRVNLGQAGAIQKNSLGENEIYFHSNGLPGSFTVLDAETGKKKFSEAIPNSEALWAITIGADKNVYFAGTGDGVLYRYLPAERRIEKIGANPSDSWVWDLEASPDGKIYGGTYEDKGNGKVFEYDMNTNTFRDYGAVMEGQDYVRGLAVDGDYIYAALGTNVHLVKIHRETGAKTEIPIAGYTGTTGTMADVFIVNNKILASVSTINMVVMDKDTYEIEHTFQYSNMISEPYPLNENLIFYKFGTKLYQYDFSTNASTEIQLPYPLPDTLRVKDMTWIEMKNGEKAGKTVLAMVTQYGEYMLFDPADNWLSFIELEIDSQPVRIQALKSWNKDGKLYLGGYQRGMSIYNPFTKDIEVNVSSFAQPEGIGFLNDYVYYGTYVGAIMYRYNPTKDVILNSNPELVYDIVSHQDRPFAITSGDNKLYVGTVADYGMLGGVLAIYDEVTDTWTQYDNVVEDQAIIGLAYKDGLLYGGTTVWGGLGSVPTQTQAKIFVWDVASGKKIDEFTPNIPNIDEVTKMIGDLSFGPDGNLWGVVDGTVFAMDVTTKEVVKSKVIMPSVYNTSKWKPFRIEWSPDGMLYTTLSRKLIVIDPETLAYKVIYDGFVNDMTIGTDGSIYFAPEAGTALSRILVPETDATLTSITINGTQIKDFSPGKLEYNSPLSAEADVKAVTTQSGAVAEITTNSTQTQILVIGTDGKSSLTYTINWNVKEPDDSDGPGGDGDSPIIDTPKDWVVEPTTTVEETQKVEGNITTTVKTTIKTDVNGTITKTTETISKNKKTGESTESIRILVSDKEGNVTSDTTTIFKDANGNIIKTVLETKTEDAQAGFVVESKVTKDANGTVKDATAEVYTKAGEVAKDKNQTHVNVGRLPKGIFGSVLKDITTPLMVNYTLPKQDILQALADADIEKLKVDVIIPNDIRNSEKIVINNIKLPKEVLEAAKTNAVDLSISILDESGKLNYTVNLNGNKLKKSKNEITDINLNLFVASNNNDALSKLISKTLQKDRINSKKNVIVLDFSHTGVLPITAEVKVNLDERNNIKAGDIYYMYYMNPETNKFDRLPNNKYAVDENLCINVNINHCSEYILLPKEADTSVVADYFDQIKGKEKMDLYIGGTTDCSGNIGITYPSTLAVVETFGTINDSAVEEVLVKTKIIEKVKGKEKLVKGLSGKVISVAKDGTVTAKGEGTACITTTVTLKNGTSRNYITTITVKKAYIKLSKSVSKMSIGDKVEFTVEAGGYDTSDIVWNSKKQDIVVVKKNVGKLTVNVAALTEGKDLLFVKLKGRDGKWMYKKHSITVIK